MGRLTAQPERIPRQGQGGDIGDVVGGVGEQGQAVGEIARHRLDADESQCQKQSQRQPELGLLAGQGEMSMGMACHGFAPAVDYDLME